MRRFIPVLILAGIFAAGIFAGKFFFQGNNTTAVPGSVSRAALPTLTANDLSVAKKATDTDKIISVASGTVRVERVIDGDTIVIEGGERVRYIGMDTPEIVDPRKPVQCFGRESAARNRELVEGKAVRLARDISDRDKYHRLLRYVYLVDGLPSEASAKEGTFVNLELVREGYATAFTYPPDVARANEFVAAEKEAREAKRGLWSACKGG